MGGAVALLVAAAGCNLATEADGPVANVKGSWHYTGQQTAPSLTLEGTLVIGPQAGDVVNGQLTWEERDALGGLVLDGGPVSGRVIALEDIDFDVLRSGGDRRHVGRIAGDTIRGAWIQTSSGASGEFLAIRETP
jgi:hypothetical protein